MIFPLKTLLFGMIGVLLTLSFMGEAMSAQKKKLYGESEYEACLMKSDAQFPSGSNGDTYCCSKSAGHCVRCPKDGNQACSIISYSRHPAFPQMSRPTQNQSSPPKVAPAVPRPKPSRPNLKTVPNTKLSQ